MSSDGRYAYHGVQPMAASYEYSGYQTPYEAAPMPPHTQNPTRPIRPNSSSQSQPQSQPQPHSPHQQHTFNSPPTQYPPPPPQTTPYAPPPQYGMPPSQPQPPPPPTPPQSGQWTAETWNHYNQSFPHQPVNDVGFSSGPGRPPDSVPNPPHQERRNYSPSQPSPDARRVEERYAPAPAASSPPKPPPKRRDKDTSSTQSSTSPSGLDFNKLMESYQLIMDSSNALTNTSISPQGRPSPGGTMERMLQSATQSVQMLENVILQSSAPEARPPPSHISVEGSPESVTAAPSSKKPKSAGEDEVQEGQTCLGCNATNTPEWRRGPLGPRTLCNACGLVYAKLIKKRARESAKRAGKTNSKGSNSLGEESGLASSDSEGEQSFNGSHGRQSELGDHQARARRD